MQLRVPPPLIVVAGALCAWGAAHAWPAATLLLSGQRPLGVALIVVGLIANVAPKLHFRRAGTTVNPLHPQRASALVQSGLHRYSRNPMYLGHVLILLGWMLCLGHPAAGLALAIYLLYIDRVQIPREEAALRERLGTGYTDYCSRVRRWL
ncbi:isoprenylcysteine carboxylmethyltransferase family protein [Xanthomonas cerealis pv. cerealis]|uniref:Isoprenylcysteine carboxylmethyltransferase family protein n=1 Tax=Xanthomonas cerealis pv. cerealis TaxID=152263 RepID=A0A514EF47_9XANT|nr:isoprenylcysteine carboxylmethyltransferase family protein [Xanthomonas translucens]QDI04657.1 isoprenylcysteine carboxylmethyltransferase family protein [Xanthomonas translucens pv. cerealis]